MKCVYLILGFLIGATYASPQFPSPPLGGWGGSGLNRPSSYPKQPNGPPGRPSPFSALSSVLPGAGGSSQQNGPQSYDDPIPQMAHDSSYDTQTLPAKLPIIAPNGVIEIYNRVVDDLIKKLQADFSKKKLDPMPVVIRSTPAGPVRVPGYLQRRPFRRPGAALYRNANIPLPMPNMPGPMHGPGPLKKKKTGRDLEAASTVTAATTVAESRFPDGRPSTGAQVSDDKTSLRGLGKVSKGPLSNEDAVAETTPVPESVEVAPKQNSTEQDGGEQDQPDASSEEGFLIRARSDEYFPEEEMEDEERKHSSPSTGNSALKKKTKKDDTMEEDDEEERTEGKSDVDSLMQKYQSKNTNKSKNKYNGTPTTKTNTNKAKAEKPKPKEKSSESDDDDDEDDVEQRDDQDDNVSYNIDAEPGTGGGGRPQGGYYPPGGPPAIPAKPNAMLTGLSQMRRSSDVAVSVDARSAMITARLLVGPVNVFVNESVEPKERGIKATIPELEAEMILMERHGVVFLQRFTLDRAYGQDIEISIPKSKGSDSKKRKGSTKGQQQGRPGQFDPNGPPVHPAAQDRFQTKMAAHISMEVVKLLRSGNLRVNLMRTAQASMSKLKLPIQKPKTKKAKKEKKEKDEKEPNEKPNKD